MEGTYLVPQYILYYPDGIITLTVDKGGIITESIPRNFDVPGEFAKFSIPDNNNKVPGGEVSNEFAKFNVPDNNNKVPGGEVSNEFAKSNIPDNNKKVPGGEVSNEFAKSNIPDNNKKVPGGEVSNGLARSKAGNDGLISKKSKRKLKRERAAIKSLPKNTKEGRLIIVKKNEKDSRIGDVRNLLLSFIYGKKHKLLAAERSSQSNLHSNSRTSVKKVVTVFVPGLQPGDVGFPPCTKFRDIDPFRIVNSRLFTDRSLEQLVEAFPITSPGSETSFYPAYNYFINRPLSAKEKQLRCEESLGEKAAIDDILMPVGEIIGHGCPVHPTLLNKNARKLDVNGKTYAKTKKFKHAGCHVFALDCEMCLCREDYVLTKITIVDFDGNIIYNHLVKPDMPITDYLTEYSGITEEKLENVTVTLEDVQRDFLTLISEDDVLVGHALSEDLHALKISHPKLVDTSVIYEHNSRPPFKPSLRYLASTHLKYDIQKDDDHPAGDAKACMDLVKMKLQLGLGFGLSKETETIYQELSKAGIKWLRLDEDSFRRREPAAVDYDAQIFQQLINNLDDNKLVVGCLKGLALSRNYPCGLSMASNKVMGEKMPSEKDSFGVLCRGLAELYERAAPGTMINVISGNGDTRLYSELLGGKTQEEKAKVRIEKSDEVEEAVSRAKDGVALFLFKQKT